MNYDKKKKGGIDMKPDDLCHKGKNYETAKDASLPGQMYVPKKTGSVLDFAGDKR